MAEENIRLQNIDGTRKSFIEKIMDWWVKSTNLFEHCLMNTFLF